MNVDADLLASLQDDKIIKERQRREIEVTISLPVLI